MILDSIEDEVIQVHSGSDRVLPRYDGHSTSNIPGTVLDLLSVENSSSKIDHLHLGGLDLENPGKVILFYIDGVSYDFVKSLKRDTGFIGRMARKGVVSPITAVFPSTTAASCTSLNTGLPPGEHNMIEWELYFHETGALMYTLPFRAVTNRYSKRSRKLDPDVLFSGATVYSRMKEAGIRSYVLVNRNISRGAYSDRIFSGSTVVPYSYITDCIIQLRNIIENDAGPLYVYVYLESADAVGHSYGPRTEMYSAEVSNISRTIKHELLDKIDPIHARDVAVIFTSDHGLVQVEPKETFYLNGIDRLWDKFEIHMGDQIPPVGSPRDVFLHVREGLEHEVAELLKKKLDGYSEVLLVEDGVKAGFFGSPEPSEIFYRRAGNVMILPEDGRTVWYRIKGQIPMHLKGLHGGMTRDEMIIPLGLSRLSSLL